MFEYKLLLSCFMFHRSVTQSDALFVQATLGIGSATTKSIVQCNVGNKRPVFLCSLFPEKTESCQLNLEFEEVEEVIFSVIGPRSVHLTGYYLSGRNYSRDDESYPFSGFEHFWLCTMWVKD